MTSRPDTPDAAAVLARVPAFSDLEPSILQAVARLAVRRRFQAGQVICLEGEPAAAIHLLESGWVKATRLSPAGREQALRFVRAPDVFGDVAVFLGLSYPGTIAALEDVTAWVIDGPAFVDLLDRHPPLARAVVRMLSERILSFTHLVEDLSLRSVEARLALNLLRNAETGPDGLSVPRRGWTTFDEMAARLGTVRDVLSRALRKLEDEGLLRVERERILLLDLDGLTERAGAP